MPRLSPIAPELWRAEQALRYAGAEVGARMTVVRLSGGRLLLHSPLRPDAELRAEVDALGSVTYLVAPNCYHHLFVGAWAEAYPAAQLFVAPGLPKKRPELEVSGLLSDAEGPWSPELEHRCWRGAPLMNEVHFFHPASRTLIVTDAVHNFGAERPTSTRLLFGLLGGSEGFRTTLLDRLVTRDRRAARDSLARLLEWDFDRVVMAHGEVLESGGKAAYAAAYAWL